MSNINLQTEILVTDPTGYKKTAVGLIPIDWEIKKLEEIGIFSKGKGILKAQVLESGLPCIRYGEIYTTHHFVIKEFKSYISEDVANESQEISKGDILFAGSGETIDDIGKAVVYIGNNKAYAGGDTIIFKPKKDNSETISYILEMDSSRKQKRTFGQGNSVVHIYPSELKKLKIPIPPLPEQQKIASILSTWDKAIDNCKDIIEELKIRNKGLAQQLLTGKMRLNGFEKAKWKEYNFGYFVEEYNKKPAINSFLPVFTSSKNGLMMQSDYYAGGRMSSREDVDYNILPDEYITYRSRSDDGLFSFNKNDKGFDGLISGYYPVFKIVNGNDKFFLYFLNYFKVKLTKYSSGTSQLVLSIKSLKLAKFNLPSSKEQKAIATILNKATKELKQYQQKLETLQLQKKGLMQQLLTGKVRTI